MVELVIKIDEDTYNNFVHNEYYINDVIAIHTALANGTPLPKGHGRLIDENNLWFEDIDDISCVTQRNVENAPPIIEADKESEVEK